MVIENNSAVLGTKYKDQVTGFEGVCIAKAQYLHDVEQACLAPKVNDKGELKDEKWFSIFRLLPINE